MVFIWFLCDCLYDLDFYTRGGAGAQGPGPWGATDPTAMTRSARAPHGPALPAAWSSLRLPPQSAACRAAPEAMIGWGCTGYTGSGLVCHKQRSLRCAALPQNRSLVPLEPSKETQSLINTLSLSLFFSLQQNRSLVPLEPSKETQALINTDGMMQSSFVIW